MRPAIALIFLAACAGAWADQHGHGDAAVPDPAQGCDTYTWNMAREFQLLSATPWALQALKARDDGARWTPLDRRLEMTLVPEAEVELLAQPERAHDSAQSYAGLMLLLVPRSSSYRISSNQRVWIEVIGPDGPVRSSKFQMRTGCEKLVKTVVFPLEPETRYWLQVSGSPVPDPVVLITLDR
jgi:hypothetical protein